MYSCPDVLDGRQIVRKKGFTPLTIANVYTKFFFKFQNMVDTHTNNGKKIERILSKKSKRYTITHL